MEAKTSEKFASGEVAYLLQGDRGDMVWGQNLSDPDSLPVFDTENKVFKLTLTNGSEEIAHYVNATGFTLVSPSW